MSTIFYLMVYLRENMIEERSSSLMHSAIVVECRKEQFQIGVLSSNNYILSHLSIVTSVHSMVPILCYIYRWH